MTAWNNLTFLQFMDMWKDVRHSLRGTPKDGIAQLIETFRTLPIETGRHIDPYSPESWPTPWEQISNRQFCHSGIGLFMYWSLRLSKIDTNNLELWYVEQDGSDVLLPVFVSDGLTVFDVVSMERKDLKCERSFDRLIARYDFDAVPSIS